MRVLASPLTTVFLTLRLALCGIVLSSCSPADVAKIQADVWNVDPRDGSIYRRVQSEGREYEEFILCTDRSAEKFKCIYDEDLKRHFEYFKTKCTCQP